MPMTLDLTGLAPESVHLVQSLVEALRLADEGKKRNQTDLKAWSAALHRWAASHPTRSIEIDDSRESIYAGRGE